MEPVLLDFAGADTPHVVIEVNQKCNIACRACYKNRSDYSKTLEQIKQEIDFAFHERNLSLVTIAGGEASLHPDLPEIIRYITRKGAQAQLLSNGYDLPDKKLAEYKRAGLNRVYIHVDSYQKRPDAKGCKNEKELYALKDSIAEKIEKHGLMASLSITLYHSLLGQLPDILDHLFASQRLHFLLSVNYTDFTGLAEKYAKTKSGRRKSGTIQSADSIPDERVTNQDVENVIKKHYGITPAFYIGSNKNKKARRWINYAVFSIVFPDGSFKIMSLSPVYARLLWWFDRVKKIFTKKYTFLYQPGRIQKFLLMIFSGLNSFNLITIIRTCHFIWLLCTKKGGELHYKFFTFQEGPNINEDGEIESCRSCPDSTVRNGELVPVCMADFLSPISRKK